MVDDSNPSASPPQGGGCSSRSAGPCSTILMIEDDPDLRQLTGLRLEREGYRVLTAAEGTEGLSLAQSKQPDVILLDIMMPAMDGREVLRRLKADPRTRDIPVVLLTIIDQDDRSYAPIRPHATWHVSKPYRSQELLQTIRQALASRSDGRSGVA